MEKYLPPLTIGDYGIALGVTLGTLVLALASPRRRRGPPPAPPTPQDVEPDLASMISQYRRRWHGENDT